MADEAVSLCGYEGHGINCLTINSQAQLCS